MRVCGKVSDLFNATYRGGKYQGYVPGGIGIGGGDYIEFCYCLECGRIQGKWPVVPKDDIFSGCEDAGDECEEFVLNSRIGVFADCHGNGWYRCKECARLEVGKCPVCGEPQRLCPSGKLCRNGHGF